MKLRILLGALIGTAAAAAIAYAASTTLTLGTSGGPGGVVVLEGATSGAVTMQPPAVAGTTTFQLPGSNGTSGQVLQTDGTGITSWAPPGGAGGIVIGTTTVTGGTCPSGQNVYNNAGIAGCQANGGGGNIPINNQTGHATYTVLSSDQGKLVTFCVTSGNVAVTLPQAGSAGFAVNWGTTLHNIDKNASGVACTGNVVVTPTTSLLNGQASVTLAPGSAISAISDATNYYGPQTVDTATGAGGIVVGTTTVTGGTCPTGQNIYNNAGIVGCQANGSGGITCDTGFTATFGECVWTKTPAADATNCKSNGNAVNCMAWTGLSENRYRLKCSNVFGSNGTAVLDIQIFNGTSWQEGATAYTFTQLGNTITGTFQTNQGITLPGIQAVYHHLTTAPFGATIMSELNDLASTSAKKVIDFRAAYEDSGASAQLTYVGFGYYSGDNNAITGVRLIDVQGTPASIAAGSTCTLTQMGS